MNRSLEGWCPERSEVLSPQSLSSGMVPLLSLKAAGTLSTRWEMNRIWAHRIFWVAVWKVFSIFLLPGLGFFQLSWVLPFEPRSWPGLSRAQQILLMRKQCWQIYFITKALSRLICVLIATCGVHGGSQWFTTSRELIYSLWAKNPAPKDMANIPGCCKSGMLSL